MDKSGLVAKGVQVKHFQVVKSKLLYDLAAHKLEEPEFE